MNIYYRPVAMSDAARPADALVLAGGWCWFDRAERLERGRPGELVPASELPAEVIDRLTSPRSAVMGLTLDRPQVMGIINVTPDSFSDGGVAREAQDAIAQAQAFRRGGADILDIGGESTRPGAPEVPVEDELGRVLQVVASASELAPVSIDTRKAAVAEAAIRAGARMVNDVSGLAFDPGMAEVVARSGVALTIVHSRGTPETMQDDPQYDEVLLDVFDTLAASVEAAEAAGVARSRIVVDPGIGFGKRLQHNLALLRGISLFHTLGVPVLVGASRKHFIGTLTQVSSPRQRLAGSLAVAQAAIYQGVQVLRVHDTSETRQVVAMTGAMIDRDGQST